MSREFASLFPSGVICFQLKVVVTEAQNYHPGFEPTRRGDAGGIHDLITDGSEEYNGRKLRAERGER